MLPGGSDGEREELEKQALRAYAEYRANLALCHVCGVCFYEQFADLIELALHDAISKLGRDIDLDDISFELTCGGCSDID